MTEGHIVPLGIQIVGSTFICPRCQATSESAVLMACHVALGCQGSEDSPSDEEVKDDR
jgi:hypothetical protein